MVDIDDDDIEFALLQEQMRFDENANPNTSSGAGPSRGTHSAGDTLRDRWSMEVLTQRDTGITPTVSNPTPPTMIFTELFDPLRLEVLASNPLCYNNKTGMVKGSDAVYNAQDVLCYLLRNGEGAEAGSPYLQVKVPYAYSSRRVKAGIDGGRLFVKGGCSMQSLSKNIRHTLAHDIYHDVDMVNCHPTLLLQVSEKQGCRLHALREYVNDREGVLAIIGSRKGWSRDETKEKLLKLMYGGDINCSGCDLLKELKENFLRIQDTIFEDPAYAHYVKALEDDIAAQDLVHAKKKKRMCDVRGNSLDNDNLKSSLLSMVLNDIENEILQCCVKFLSNHGVCTDNLVLVFDGFMVPKMHLPIISDDFKNALSSYVFESTGWNVKFEVKPMDNIIDLTGLKASFVPDQIVIGDREAAKVVQQYLKYKGNPLVKCDGALYCRYYNTKQSLVWGDDDDAVFGVFSDACAKANIYMVDKKTGKSYLYSHDVDKKTKIMKEWKAGLVYTDNELLKNIREMSRGKIFFSRNMVYDLEEGVYRPFDETRDATLTTVEDEFYPPTAETKRTLDEEVYPFLCSVFPCTQMPDGSLKSEEAECFFRLFARAMGGHTKDKRYIIMYGPRNSGKGALFTLLQKAFKGYHADFATSDLRTSMGEDALSLKWLGQMQGKRFALANESTTSTATGASVSLDGALIKRLISAEDTIMVRQLYGKKLYPVVPEQTFILNCNDMPKVDPHDALRTAVQFKLYNEYVDPYEFETQIAKRRPSWKRADPSIKVKCISRSWVDAIRYFTTLMYTKGDNPPPLCSGVMDAAYEERELADDPDTHYNLYFEFTGDDNDLLPSSVALEIFKDHFKKLNITKSKFYQDMYLRGAKKPENKTYNSKFMKCWAGVKLIENENDV